MQGATLEALIAGHPAGRAAALLQQRAYKVKGKEGMALRQRITSLEEQATGMSTSTAWMVNDNHEAVSGRKHRFPEFSVLSMHFLEVSGRSTCRVCCKPGAGLRNVLPIKALQLDLLVVLDW